jgi:hypothetical protein
MPASRAASGLPPTARVRRPKVVRLSRTQPKIATSTKMTTSTGTPRTLPPKKSMNARLVMIWVLRWAMISASPRAPASIARVAMNGAMRP